MSRPKGSKNKRNTKTEEELKQAENKEKEPVTEPIHSYISELKNYDCAECGELLPVHRQHWIDSKYRHLCKVHAAEVVKWFEDPARPVPAPSQPPAPQRVD